MRTILVVCAEWLARCFDVLARSNSPQRISCGQPVNYSLTESRVVRQHGAVAETMTEARGSQEEQMAKYSPAILRSYSSSLYALGYLEIALGLSVGGIAGYVAWGAFGAALGVLTGFFVGFICAYMLFTAAQLILCVVKIEKNTQRTMRATVYLASSKDEAPEEEIDDHTDARLMLEKAGLNVDKQGIDDHIEQQKRSTPRWRRSKWDI